MKKYTFSSTTPISYFSEISIFNSLNWFLILLYLRWGFLFVCFLSYCYYLFTFCYRKWGFHNHSCPIYMAVVVGLAASSILEIAFNCLLGLISTLLGSIFIFYFLFYSLGCGGMHTPAFWEVYIFLQLTCLKIC